MTGGCGEGEEVTGADGERNWLSGSNCRSNKQGYLHLGGPDKGDGKPVDEVKLAGEECFRVADRTQSSPRAGAGTGEWTGSRGSSSRGEEKLVRVGCHHH